MAKYKFSAVIEKEENAYVSHCVELGIASQGDSIEEAIANLKEAIELYLKHADPEEKKLYERKEGEPILASINIK